MILFDLLWATAQAAPTALADEAVSAVGIHAGRRIESLARLREMEKRLYANIRREMDALASVQAAISREEAADAAMVVEAVASDLEQGIGLALIDGGQADDAPKRKRNPPPVIKSEAA